MSSEVREWSSYGAGNNRGAVPGWAPENQVRAPDLNDIYREWQASWRRYYDTAQWVAGYPNGTDNPDPVTVAYVSATSFRLNGINATAVYEVGRRVKAEGAVTTTIYGDITASVFSGGNTICTVAWDSGSLANEALTVHAHIMSTNERLQFGFNPSPEPLWVQTPSGDAYFRAETALGSAADPRMELYRGQGTANSRYTQLRSNGTAWYFERGNDDRSNIQLANIYAADVYDNGFRVYSDNNPPDTGGAAVPIGAVISWSTGTETPSADYLECNGLPVLVNDWPALFAVIGYTYGGSGGVFNIPDLRERAIAGAGTYAIGTKYGSAGVILSAAESGVAPHGHTTTITPTGAKVRVFGGNTGDQGDGISQPQDLVVNVDQAAAPATVAHPNEGPRAALGLFIRAQ